jgi:hypothetical protein
MSVVGPEAAGIKALSYMTVGSLHWLETRHVDRNYYSLKVHLLYYCNSRDLGANLFNLTH